MSRTRANMTTAQVVAILSREKPVFLEGLTQVEAETVAAKATIQRYPANTMITNEAYPASHLFLLLEGAARGYVLTSRGERIGLGWFHDGQLLGWAAIISRQLDYIVAFEAVMTSTVLAWDRATVQSLKKTYPRLLENMLVIAYDFVSLYRTLHLSACCDPAERRLARVLCYLAEGMGRRVANGFELHISNEELANEAHVTPDTVNNLTREWRQRGLLTKGRGRLVVHQPDVLLGA